VRDNRASKCHPSKRSCDPSQGWTDETWAIRYLVVYPGAWLAGRLVLVSPIALRQAGWQSKRLDVALTKKQIAGSPSIGTHKTISRQHEAVSMGYYGDPDYLGWSSLWGLASRPAGLTVQKESGDGSGSGASQGGNASFKNAAQALMAEDKSLPTMDESEETCHESNTVVPPAIQSKPQIRLLRQCPSTDFPRPLRTRDSAEVTRGGESSS
jgi:hypothetical protein